MSVPLVDHRYELHDQLGSGGMGTVHRAVDRLSNRTIALKRVSLSGKKVGNSSNQGSHDVRLRLAQEFRTLASLRHPNIISVLDYGFDAQNNPYYTMELLEGAHPLTQADLSPDEAVHALIGLFEALNYLHQREILHRDLKPANVLRLQHGPIKVLDFGLALATQRSSLQMTSEEGIAGTFAYLAPEIIEGTGHASIESDLYSAGVLMYEMLVGQRPFRSTVVGPLLVEIIATSPDMSAIDDDLQPIVTRLLHKQAEQRYHSAVEVISDLYQALGTPPPPEHAAIRESYLQGSTFVGRREEIEQFKKALEDVASGYGGMWLVGGERGVGKSRLLEEVKHRAMVTHSPTGGTLVLTGETIAHGQPYTPWKAPLRRLILSTEVSDFEARILKPIIPDIDNLLGRPIEAAPALSSQSSQDRIDRVIVDLFLRQKGPVVLLIEDLHWAEGSLRPLVRLEEECHMRPLLIVGSYRTDEDSPVASRFPLAHVIRLNRLTRDEIAALSASMLGVQQPNDNIVNLLERETEGNTLFIVEVMRELIQEAGRVADVQTMTLPEHVFAGGVEQIIKRRLERVPAEYDDLMALAAVGGRYIDLTLLEEIQPSDRLMRWLNEALDAAVLDIHDTLWRFSHDQMRHIIIKELPEEKRRSLHRKIATHIEKVYAGDLDSHLIALAEHWHAAHDHTQATRYALRAARQLNALSRFQEAQRIAQQALAVASEKLPRLHLHYVLGVAHEGLSNLLKAAHHFERSLTLAIELKEREHEADALIGAGRVAWDRGDFIAARAFLHEGLVLSEERVYHRGIADSLRNLGSVEMFNGNIQQALTIFNRALAGYQALEYVQGSLICKNNIGRAACLLRDFDTAKQMLNEALALCQQTGDRLTRGACLYNLGEVARAEADNASALTYYQQAVAIFKEVGAIGSIVRAMVTLTMLHTQMGEHQAARGTLAVAAVYADQINTWNRHLWVILAVADLKIAEGHIKEAAQLVGLALNHAGEDAYTHQQAERLLETLQSHERGEDLVMWLSGGDDLSVDKIFAQVLDGTLLK